MAQGQSNALAQSVYSRFGFTDPPPTDSDGYVERSLGSVDGGEHSSAGADARGVAVAIREVSVARRVAALKRAPMCSVRLSKRSHNALDARALPFWEAHNRSPSRVFLVKM